MKLKELFDKYTFDEILPYLRKIDAEKNIWKCIANEKTLS